MKKIIKRNGKQELFDPQKLCDSIQNIGASEDLSQQVCQIVSQSVDDNVSSENIFTQTRKYLFDIEPKLAALYALERGISALGPSGFLFEQYVAAMFQDQGYRVETNEYYEGEAVEHEVDVIAHKGNMTFIIEAKYRNDYKNKTHINQVMYADARLQDIKRRKYELNDEREYYLWVITNTQFTDNAQRYVSKRDLQLLGWDYPSYINIKKIVHEKKLYPVTVISSMTRDILRVCAQEETVLVKDLFPLSLDELQEKFSISKKEAQTIEREINLLMVD